MQAAVDIVTEARRGISRREGYREMRELHGDDDAEEGSTQIVADDRRLSEQQVDDIRGRQMVSQRRDVMWCPSGVMGGTTRVESHV